MVGSESTTRGLILLIEDEPAVARLTELVLIGAGFSVVLAKSYQHVPEILGETGFNLVIADTQAGSRAPWLDGLSELTQAAGCPVLLFSAHRFTQEQVSDAGLAGVIPKPFDIDELVAVVEQTLRTADTQDGEDTHSGR